MASETALYPPVKRFLEERGFLAKGEIGGCDIVALKAGEPPIVIVCELKQSFNLELLMQASARVSVSDEVWIAARLSVRGKGRESDSRYRNLCRRLGIGMLGVTAFGGVVVLVSPAAATPRRDARKRSRLVEEHRRRQGDPAAGGGTRVPIMTAYRQEALACAAALAAGPARTRDLSRDVPRAPKILLHNVYGWFVRHSRGIYGLTPAGQAALARWPTDAPVLAVA